MFEISVTSRFCAAHHLEGYPGSCAGVHGHNWSVEVFVTGEEVDRTGILLDFRALRDSVAEVIAGLDHSDLNAVEAFRGRNPTSEHVARFLYDSLSARLDTDRVRVDRVSVSETPESRATYRGARR